jgi:hypothetical protein
MMCWVLGSRSSVLLASFALTACTFDPPPDATLTVPEDGIFLEGDPLVLVFSEPIEESTLTIAIWPGDRDIENELTGTPILSGCTASTSPCGTTVLEVDDDRLGAQVLLDPEEIGQPDVPLALQIAPGLEDENGNPTGASYFFDFQFKPLEVAIPDDPIEFDSGVYIIVAVVDDPLPTIVTLVTDIQVNELGEAVFAGADGDEIAGAPRNTQNPDELYIDDGDEGYTIFSTGHMRLVDGERFLETIPFEVELSFGPIVVTIESVRLDGIVVTDEDTGNDRLEGTFSYTGITIQNGDDAPFGYDAGSVTYTAVYVRPNKVPEGTPMVCGDLCGAVTGRCTPPEGFPPAGFCQ